MYPQPLRVTQQKVLIVEDDPEARRQLRSLLVANDYAVIEAGNGRIARSLLGETEVDLVVSDIFMPVCDGFELIAAIRTMDHPIPVIAMSDHESWTGRNFLDAANDLGAAAVIEKPFQGSVLLRLINQALTKFQRETRVGAFGTMEEAKRSCVPSSLEWVGSRPVDDLKALERTPSA